MKTIFIINPCAGQGKKAKELKEKIQKTAEKSQVYLTRRAADAKKFVKKYCKKYGPARFIACGGDGTLNEVLNGAIAEPEAEIGVIPIGTGNDFCRNFKDGAEFSDAYLQATGDSVKCDAIRYSIFSKGKEKIGYCANMFNIGFDCNVADKVAELKKKPFISGSFAYLASVLLNLIKKNGANLKIEIDGKVKHDGKLLLTSIANGCFCGGGIKSNPLAELNDGLISVNIVKDVPRREFIKLLPNYMKGSFLNLPKIDEVIWTGKCEKITITPNNGEIKICIDGEIESGDRIEFEIAPGAFNFVIPAEKSVKEKDFARS
ncbi:MAG: hypothetical protein IJE44_03505 [Clostridia bacterium]|nr:hypothetical protein [Clostridia bacterium]